MAHEETTVLFIVGFTRSGSTLLGNVLGELPGIFYGGELQRLFWRDSLLENRRCGCGRPFDECPIWSEVTRNAYGGVPPRELSKGIVATQRRRLRARYIPRFLRMTRNQLGRAPDLVQYAEEVSRLYRAVASATGADVIVDSSKLPAYAAATTFVPGITPFFVHLVRDPRGAAHSWSRKKEGLGRVGAWLVARQWLKFNAAAELIKSSLPARRSAFLRYEDFAAAPDTALPSLCRLVGHSYSADRTPLLDGAVRLTTNHTVAANPDRFKTGVIPLRPDEAWRDEMPALRHVFVTLVTYPLGRRYGYGRSG